MKADKTVNPEVVNEVLDVFDPLKGIDMFNIPFKKYQSDRF